MRVGVYVDAFNVYYAGRNQCGRNTPGWRWLDLSGLAMSLINPYVWPDAELIRLVYCTAPPHRVADPSSIADQQTYIDALCVINPCTVVEYGKYVVRTKKGVILRPGGNPNHRLRSPGAAHLPGWLPASEVPGPDGTPELLVSVSSFEEKGSDVNVATHLLLDVLSGSIDAAMVFSNDSDLRLPLEQARLRVPVATINPGAQNTASALRGDRHGGAGRHRWRRLRADDYYRHQLPDPVGSHQRPPGW